MGSNTPMTSNLVELVADTDTIQINISKPQTTKAAHLTALKSQLSTHLLSRRRLAAHISSNDNDNDDKEGLNLKTTIKIYTPQNLYCCPDTLVEVLTTVFTPEYYPIITGLEITLEIEQIDEAVLLKRLREAAGKIRGVLKSQSQNQSGDEEVKLGLLRLEVRAFDARSVMEGVIRAVCTIFNNSSSSGGRFRYLQELGVVTKWGGNTTTATTATNGNGDGNAQLYKSAETVTTVYIPLDLLKSPTVKRLHIEDKSWSRLVDRVAEVVASFPAAEEVYLDYGVGQKLVDYSGLLSLKNLEKLSIPFPYAGSLKRTALPSDICCMRALLREYIADTPAFKACILDQTASLREIVVWYVRGGGGGGGDVTGSTRVRIHKDVCKNGRDGEVDVDMEEGEIIGEPELVSYLTMEDLGDKPTDPEDRCSIAELMRKGGDRTDTRRFLKPQESSLWPFGEAVVGGNGGWNRELILLPGEGGGSSSSAGREVGCKCIA
ncbi:hypothetical protein TWF730_006953 [Orbilia blumenaviensis]|uniref:Uncharacterized protein n=1 Tax=Orbilia blumenaviensis TaxID=1796055 RepID=A0AAV9VJ79_9PEZI